MVNDRHLQFRRNLNTLYPSFTEAKTALEAYVVTNANDLKDGEILLARYGASFDTAKTSVGTIVKTATSTTISFDLQSAIEYTDKALSGFTPTGKTEITSTDKSINVTDDTDVAVNKDGVTIKQNTENELFAADAIIEQGFKVLGTNVGELTSGTEIADGTTVIELLKKMLVKEADCTVINPYISLALSTTGVCEVGTEVTQTLTATYHDGQFKYDAVNYGTASDTYHNAGCAQGAITYKRGSETLSSSSDTVTMAEGTTTWSASASYGASTFQAKKNNGENSSQSISASETSADSKSVTAQYKYYYGATTAATPSDVTTNGLTTGWTTVNATTTIKSASQKYTLPEDYFVIMCQDKYKLGSIQDNTSDTDYKPNFKMDTKTITIGGGATATYKVYLWVKSKATPDVKNITLVKA